MRDRAITPEDAREWLLKHLASAPERDDDWYRRVLNICVAPTGEQTPPASLVSHGDS